MLIACRRTTTDFIRLYNRSESIFASSFADRVFTSFHSFRAKRANPEVTLYRSSCHSSSMDPNSIITQVSRDQDQLNSSYQGTTLPSDSRGEICSFYVCM